jgi:WhiB family redox-sensing transcriptional regulator
MPHEWWFPLNVEQRGMRRRQRDNMDLALKTCSGCPVKTECLDDALEARLPFGIFGGMTATDRHELLTPGRRPYTFRAR